MRKFCKILSVFILCLICFLLFGCDNNDKLYFKLTNNNYEILLNETINLNDLEYKTNIKDKLYFNFNIEDESIVKIEDNKLTAISVGKTKVYINVKYKNKTYYQYIFVNVINTNNEEETLRYDKTIETVGLNINVAIIKIYKDNNSYQSFNFYIDEKDMAYILEVRKIGSKLEITYYSDYSFEVKIESKTNINNFIILNI